MGIAHVDKPVLEMVHFDFYIGGGSKIQDFGLPEKEGGCIQSFLVYRRGRTGDFKYIVTGQLLFKLLTLYSLNPYTVLRGIFWIICPEA